MTPTEPGRTVEQIATHILEHNMITWPRGLQRDIAAALRAERDRATNAEHKLERMKHAFSLSSQDIEQTLGKALGYPWFKDYQANFPGATEADGVCVGEHVSESIAAEAAKKIVELRAALAEAVEAIRPFAAIGSDLEPELWADNQLLFSQGSGITVGHCRRAREVVSRLTSLVSQSHPPA